MATSVENNVVENHPKRYQDSPINMSSKHGNVKNSSLSSPPPTTSSLRRSESRRTSAGGSMTTSATGKTNYRREIAALDFLLGIPMKAERDIVHQGWLQQNGMTIVDRKKPRKNRKKSDNTNDMEDPLAQSGNDIPQMVGQQGTWWEKWVTSKQDPSHRPYGNIDEEELEQPHQLDGNLDSSITLRKLSNKVAPVSSIIHVPGRRLEGDDAIRIEVPPELKVSSARQRQIARLAAKREWELQVAHGIRSNSTLNDADQNQNPPMLDGRIFFSAAGSYPCQVFSVIRYEPKREEAARRRKKLEARGGGGSEFLVPSRDWRGISYRALLPARRKLVKKGNAKSSKDYDGMMFDRFQSRPRPNDNDNNDPSRDNKTNTTKSTNSTHGGSELVQDSEEEDDDETDDDEQDTYVPGLLDDPEMTLGRHRNVMVGDRTTGCIVASTIQFVQPALLKADLNKQFRERFDGWEPPKVMRKFIHAKIVDGHFTLMEDENSLSELHHHHHHSKKNVVGTVSGSGGTRKRQSSVSPLSPGGPDASERIIRMPPSLTLSKIRSLKQQALMVAVKARLEISTVALAIVYFERLCLDCRIDKSNRRLSFAACLLLAIKINESHVSVAKTDERDDLSKLSHGTTNRIQSLYRSTKTSNNMFATLLEFFTQKWEISLKHLFSAEWGVFAALQFRLHAKPSQVAFHFKRLLKSLDWNPRRYLGGEMFFLWQAALAHEEYLRQEKKVRLELRQQKEKEKLMRMQREIGSTDTFAVAVEDDTAAEESNNEKASDMESTKETPPRPARSSIGQKKPSRLGLSILNRLGSGIGSSSNKRSLSTERIPQRINSSGLETEHRSMLSASPSLPALSRLTKSPSLPSLPVFLPRDGHNLETMPTITLSPTSDTANLLQQENSQDGADDQSLSEHSETSVIMI